jgi:hypothetical protein
MNPTKGTVAYERHLAWGRAKRARVKAETPEVLTSRRKLVYANTRAVSIAAAAAWQRANPDKTRVARRKWKQSNRAAITAATALRRARLLQATPPWLTEEHLAAIRAVYAEAKALGPDYQVDHIHPLRGKRSCGLHVPWNLQIMKKHRNQKKSNKLRVI